MSNVTGMNASKTLNDLIKALEEQRNSRVVCYCTGDRQGQEVQIGEDAPPILAQHLFRIGKVDRLDLLIYSRGGNTLSGFSMANSLREFADEVNVLIPFRAHSCATLIALSANHIVTGPFAQLSPIDPSITTAHGPRIEQAGNTQFIPVSVEDVANYFELARKEAGLKNDAHLAEVFSHLTKGVSPLALGAVYRAREQIGMLANKLLALHSEDVDGNNRIVRKLTRELLSHDYIISRREAKEMGMCVVDANNEEADLMWTIYRDVAMELCLDFPWNWEVESQETQPRSSKRAIFQSRDFKHVFTSTYHITRNVVEGKVDFQVMPTDEGSWREIELS